MQFFKSTHLHLHASFLLGFDCLCVIVLQGFGMSLDPCMRQDLRQDVRRVWFASILILSETIGNRTCKAVREPFCRWLNVLPFWKRTLWWGPWGSHWDLLSSRYSFINMTTQPHPVAFPTPGHSSRGLMNLFWILSPPDRNYIPSFCYNKERNWCESTSCRLPSEFISFLQTRLPTPPICAPHPRPTPANAKKKQQIQCPRLCMMFN